VDLAANGIEALALLRTKSSNGTDWPSLILLDLMMPEMNGWQFCEEQKKDDALSTIPVVVISAAVVDRSEQQRDKGRPLLKKPIELVRLLDAVLEHAKVRFYFHFGGARRSAPSASRWGERGRSAPSPHPELRAAAGIVAAIRVCESGLPSGRGRWQPERRMKRAFLWVWCRFGVRAFAATSTPSVVGASSATSSASAAHVNGKMERHPLHFIGRRLSAGVADAREQKPLFVDTWATWCHTAEHEGLCFSDPKPRRVPTVVWLSIIRRTENAAFVSAHPMEACRRLGESISARKSGAAPSSHSRAPPTRSTSRSTRPRPTVCSSLANARTPTTTPDPKERTFHLRSGCHRPRPDGRPDSQTRIAATIRPPRATPGGGDGRSVRLPQRDRAWGGAPRSPKMKIKPYLACSKTASRSRTSSNRLLEKRAPFDRAVCSDRSTTPPKMTTPGSC